MRRPETGRSQLVGPVIRWKGFFAAGDPVEQAADAAGPLVGCRVLAPIGWIDEAVDFTEHHACAIDSAVIDIKLHGEKSYQIASALTWFGIWFMFTKGYDK
jgi:hypothetical protein